MRMVTWMLVGALLIVLVVSVLVNAWGVHILVEDPIRQWELWHCPWCPNVYVDQESLKWHMKLVHGGGKMNVKEMVKKVLADNSFDGLFNDSGECACSLLDLVPCQDDWSDCEPGYMARCDCGEQHSFHIVAEKPTGKRKNEVQ